MNKGIRTNKTNRSNQGRIELDAFNMKYYVYWLRSKSQHTNIHKEGYVGVTDNYNLGSRHRKHQGSQNHSDKLKDDINQFGDFVMERVKSFASHQEALDYEYKLRPKPNIGYNSIRGGNLISHIGVDGIWDIINRLKKGEYHKDIAKVYSISQKLVSEIAKRNTGKYTFLKDFDYKPIIRKKRASLKKYNAIDAETGEVIGYNISAKEFCEKYPDENYAEGYLTQTALYDKTKIRDSNNTYHHKGIRFELVT